MGYIRERHPFFQRIKALWCVLTTRNFIIVSVNEYEKDDKSCRTVRPLYRTDYDTESDVLTLRGALHMCEKRYEQEK